jgi:DnaB-like helicase N terminal domain
MTTKRLLEDTILGALICNGYDGNIREAMQFLTFKNFETYSDFDNKMLFKCISEMYPNETIDLCTIAFRMKQIYKNDCAKHLIELTNKVASTTNTLSHCACLLQIDLTDKFCRLLNDLSNNNSIPIDERLLVSGYEKEIREGRLDILLSVPAFLKMAKFKNLNNTIIVNASKFNDAVNEKCKGIRERQKTLSILSNMQILCKSEKAQSLFNQLKAEL